MLLTGLFLIAYSAQVPLPKGGTTHRELDLQNQSSIKIMSQGLPTGQSDGVWGGGGVFFVEILSSQITLACIKLKANKPAQPWTSGLFEAGIREE